MRRIAVDFDGTLVEEKWPEIGDWLPGAVDALKELASIYDEVVIFSCRLAKMDTDEVTPRENYDQIILMNLMLEQAKIPGNVILWTKDYKPPAECYVDDRAMKFFGDWRATLKAISMNDRDPGDEQADELDWHGGFDDRTLWATIDANDPRLSTTLLRTFETGATRDTDDGKWDYEGFLSPVVLRRYAEYMHKHRIQSDGTLRASDNWQKGIPFDAYMKSGWRHFMDWWFLHREWEPGENVTLEEALCALIFNASGYLHELMVR